MPIVHVRRRAVGLRREHMLPTGLPRRRRLPLANVGGRGPAVLVDARVQQRLRVWRLGFGDGLLHVCWRLDVLAIRLVRWRNRLTDLLD
jgi:hypothetical protein